MTDREKVIRGLECHSEPHFGLDECFCETCPYDELTCGLDVPADALKLLKAQEPRVMELEEIKAAAFGGGMYWLEFRSICAPALMIEQKANYKIEFAVLHSRGYGPVVVGQFHPNEYKKVWRCWTSRPTDEQRESVPWNGCGDSCPIERSDAD